MSDIILTDKEVEILDESIKNEKERWLTSLGEIEKIRSESDRH